MATLQKEVRDEQRRDPAERAYPSWATALAFLAILAIGYAAGVYFS